MEEAIQIIEKPDWVSWEDIHNVIWLSHKTNRERGINMIHAAFSGKEIEDYLAPTGKMYLAIQGSRVIGVIASKEKKAKFWFGTGVFVYCCFAAVLPEFRGKGVYGALMKQQERIASLKGIDKVLLNTHPNNTRVIAAALKNGYKKVSYTEGNDCPWVYLVKWVNGAPYPDYVFNAMYGSMKTLRMTRKRMLKLLKK